MDKDKILTVIAENIRNLMNKADISSITLARKCKISSGTISKVIHGNMSITIPMAMNLAQGLNVDINELLVGLTSQKIIDDLSQKPIIKKNPSLSIGVLSINNKRITCIKNPTGEIIGTSELEGGLDLAGTSRNLIQLIQESIIKALSDGPLQFSHKLLKAATLNLVTQSYEFEETRNKFLFFAEKYFQKVLLLSDWQITYLTSFVKQPGISLVTDKGVSLSYLHNHILKKLGGWKFPVYDLGGENWLGVETIRHTIEATEGYIPVSQLASNVLSRFNGKIEKITETCFKGSKDPDIYCLFAEILIRSYLMEDVEAKVIIEKGFKQIYKAIEHVDKITGTQLSICLNGSLANIYKKFFNQTRLVSPSSNSDKVSLLANITTEFLSANGIKDR